ncbi:MAG: nucleoside hydrolase, partial [Spirochaetota bacterium]
ELPVALVGIGPWTNVAAVIERADSRQRSRIAQIALMGGELHLNMAESNLKHDPEAARVIFGSGLPVFDATWSVSRRLAFPIDEVRRLCERPASPLVRVLNEATERWWGDGMKLKPGPVCYDVVPVFWAAGEREAISCIGLEEIPVELDGSLTRGMLVSHPWRLEQAPRVGTTSPGSIAVTCDMDERALSRRYMELIFG